MSKQTEGLKLTPVSATSPANMVMSAELVTSCPELYTESRLNWNEAFLDIKGEVIRKNILIKLGRIFTW